MKINYFNNLLNYILITFFTILQNLIRDSSGNWTLDQHPHLENLGQNINPIYHLLVDQKKYFTVWSWGKTVVYRHMDDVNSVKWRQNSSKFTHEYDDVSKKNILIEVLNEEIEYYIRIDRN